ncbi:hypothetical protein AAG906_001655 [Vitis piasezkii]
MATLLYFEEKVHRKKLLRVDAIPLLFPRLLLPSTRPMPEVAPSAPPATPRTPLHLGIPSPPEHAIPIPLEPTDPSQGPPLSEQTMPLEEPTTGEIEPSIMSIPTSTAEPSSPHDPPTTI